MNADTLATVHPAFAVFCKEEFAAHGEFYQRTAQFGTGIAKRIDERLYTLTGVVMN